MSIQLPKSQIIKQFKLNGYNIDSLSLKYTAQYLVQDKNNEIKLLKNLLKKINQITINSNQKFSQKIVKIAIQILQQGCQKKFKNFEQIVEDIRKWSIMYISPYENHQSRCNFIYYSFYKYLVFIPQPQSIHFKFQPNDPMLNDIKRFRQVQSCTKEQLKSKNNQYFIGVLYEDFSKTSSSIQLDMTQHRKSKLVLQNQANQLEIIIPQNYQHNVPLVPGCIYAVKGKYLSKNLVLVVNEILLPFALPQDKSQTFIKQKFIKMCQNINLAKNSLNFQAQDFYKYSTIYNQVRNTHKNTLIFGSVKICKQTIARILKILTQLGDSVECVILMLDDGQHQQINLKIWFKDLYVFIVPHIYAEGPRLLPKVPILKKNFYATKVLTNPAKFSFYSRQIIFMNLPLMKSIYQKNILNSKKFSVQINQQKMAQSIADLLFSQGTTQFCSDIYPKQNQYFKIKQDTIIVVSDKACHHMEYTKDAKKGSFVSVGNFQRDGHFLCYYPKSKKPIQLCEQIGE